MQPRYVGFGSSNEDHADDSIKWGLSMRPRWLCYDLHLRWVLRRRFGVAEIVAWASIKENGTFVGNALLAYGLTLSRLICYILLVPATFLPSNYLVHFYPDHAHGLSNGYHLDFDVLTYI
jgi:hypothetical protein